MRRACAALALLLAACTQTPPQVPSERPGSLGALDAAYDRDSWRWVRNPDGRDLLAHAQIAKCFVDPKPAQHFSEPEFTVKREQKTIGAARYNVMNVVQGRDFWIAVYQREGASAPALGVYSEGRCREAAEGILRAHETKKGPV